VVWIATLVAIGVASGWGNDVGESVQGQWELARWLAWGLLLGGAVQLALHVPPLARFGLSGDTGGERADAWQVLRATGPLVLGAAIYQINVMIDTQMANSLLRPGGASVVYYANRLQQFPMALIATAAVNAVFPLLNAHGHLGERAKVRALHDRTQLAMLFLALPAATGMVALALPIASVCYEHGNFGLDGTLRTAEGLRCLAFGLVPAGAAALASRVFVAMGDLRTPVRIAIWMLILNATLNLLCVVGLGFDVAGLTLSTAVTAWINLAWLLLRMRTTLGLPAADPALRTRIGKIVVAALVCALAAFAAQRGVAAAIGRAGALEARGSLAALVAGLASGAVSFALAARALAIPEWEEMVRRIGARLRPRS
jgi:putative peptidoglycan lipid II flippase